MDEQKIHDIQTCGFVQELNHYKKTTAPKTSGYTQQMFDRLFPYGPAVNALLATLYISGPPNFLLALCPPNIDPSSLSVMVAFAVGGLLGDTVFHLLPEIFLGETSPDHARFVLVDPNKNLLLGVAIIFGFVTFTLMDKSLRIATGGEGGHDQAHGKKEDTEDIKKDQVSKATGVESLSQKANGTVKSRKSIKETSPSLEIFADLKDLLLPKDKVKELWSTPEPSRSNDWLAEVLQADDTAGVTQIAIWRAYEAAFKGNKGVPILEATALIHSASKVFENASAQIIEGEERKFIIKGVRPQVSEVETVADTAKAIVKSAKPSVPKNEPGHSIRLSAYLNLIADFTHNITDGLALSSSFYASPMLGATTTVAIFFHEIPHEVGDFALLIQSGFSKRKAMGAQFITAFGAFLGTCLGILVQELAKSDFDPSKHRDQHADNKGILETGLGWGDMLLPFTAGTFLYVGTVAVIPELLQTGPRKGEEVRKTMKQFIAMFIGAGIMLA
ncbi:uncharacterized protein KY384_008219 [Bacidia gigantensis]|uniref:uncharacterized protein n=1 Tax=Bacidia gigantensis TaxID=2732470 RepID=UPI001D038850|nr:uncharacterized protein KY384_008219 [Bacidia gigantensis]KAG8526790.1 hypothetical protein KY384_008219 [Bacidia gigantensis]